VIPDAGEILHPAAADEHDRVLLKVVADTRNVRADLEPVGEAHAADLPERGVGLFRGLREDARANAALLG